jgi:hypothetical protein
VKSNVILLVCLLAAGVLAGCGGAVVSPTDQSLISQADQLHGRLKPALIDDRDPRLRSYFEQVMARVTGAARQLDQQGTIRSAAEGDNAGNAWMFAKNIDLHLVNSPEPAIFPSGGRHIYLYDGLFQQCLSEEELAALVCHAYAHLYLRHVQDDLRPNPGYSGEPALLVPFATLQFTPTQERAADTVAFQVYTRAGWDPSRFGGLYEHLYKDEVSGLDRGVLRERTLDANRRLPELPAATADWLAPPVADDVRFAQLQGEVKKLIASAGRDTQAQLLLAAFPNCLNPAPTPAQARARQALLPPPPAPTENQWGKGVQGR